VLKAIFFLVVFSGMVFTAYNSAHQKMNHRTNLQKLSLGMNVSQIEETFGVPTAQNRNQLIYVLDDSSELTITLRDNVATSAQIKFINSVKVNDPELKKLTLVQMDPEETHSGKPNWFFAGKPEEGLIYKITASGIIESITWVQPFTYRNVRPKNVQVLVRDFNTRELSSL
jgi:hypothetical protein